MVAICRLCASLKKSDSLTFIRDNNHDLCRKLLKCCQLKIDLNNGLPRGVCQDCIRNLNASFEFFVRVHESQQSLDKLLNVQKKLKNDIIIKNNTTPDVYQISEERKSFDLIAAATASRIDEKEILVSCSDNIEPLIVDEDDQIERGSSKAIICSENEALCEIKIKKPKRETYKLVISNEQVITVAETEELLTPDSDLQTVEEEEVEDNSNYSGDYEFVEALEANHSKLEQQANRGGSIERSHSSPLVKSEDGYCQEEDAGFSGFVGDRINTSTWLDYLWKCVYCSQIFSNAEELARHYEYIEEKELVWVCTDCLKEFTRYYSLINHIRQRHRQHLELLCDICNEDCKSFTELNTHRQSMHDNDLFNMLICSTCGKGFNNTNSLQIHSKCHLPDDMRLQFSCNMCDKKFRSASNLKFHGKMHAGMKDYVCDQCGKKFMQRANLEEHLVTHTDISPYECDLCNKLFKTSERLSKHKTRHTDDKPFRCDWIDCDKTFRTKHAMNSHGRIHTGEMPFKCEFCQKPFRFRSTLLTHHNTHTGIRPYSCIDCNHQFTNWPNYNKHMKRRHGVDVSSKNPRGKKPSKPRTITDIKLKDPEKKTKSDGCKSEKQKIDYDNPVEKDLDENEELNIILLEEFDTEYEPEEDIT